ncbi:MAG TPA: GNAT family N-acetyltransferase [Spirochaetota bacterium]|nr:GNAT family N-acetyltransferase [Spirochaetota bacterium]
MDMADVEIDDKRERIDLEKVHSMLASTYWSKGISKEEILRGIDHSALVVGAYHPDHGQVGFLRVVSDMIRFAYLGDVIVDERFRGRSIGQRMVDYTISHPSLGMVYKWLLTTADAHGLYAKSGFQPLQRPEMWMILDKGIPVFPRDINFADDKNR